MKTKQVALVTGASSGIGKEIARQLLADGLEVYVAARRVEKMADLEALGAHAIPMDITQEADIAAAVAQIGQHHGGVDVLVNNAGYGSYGAMEDTSLEDARYQFEVNLFGLARLTQHVLPYMRGKKAGRIINISSMGGRIYTPLGAWYHATKHALEGWSDCLRLEVAQFGIDVVVIQPGAIASEFGDVLVGPMMARSGKTVYAGLADTVKKSIENSAKKGGSSPASVISRVVSRAVHAKRPKTRYAAGKFARPLMFARKWLGDRVFDKMVMQAMG